ncbi:hypothetical protein L211DRAFT_857697 [Terfezia boudieri ATCC MYA-4762]|uniref:Dynactin subunit 6 n=1 Tax=Terfezia boudieri ATCC MYA-4762 TaxID=1051890 RepID=A0A3N4LK52_9PEZI|nr:hypothetical protein L211DRAFT_857697 [Terfezia boudieri ATCC MYA-4762]
MPPRTRPSASTEPVSKSPVDLHPACVIDGTAQLTGTYLIRVGANTIIHPKARLNSSNGPITIGESCIISERCMLQAADTNGLVVGDAVSIECNAVVEGREVKEGTDVEVGNCKLCPMTEVAEQEVVPDYTVMYGYSERRIDASGSEGARRKFLDKHIEALKALIVSNPAKFKA